MQTDIDEEVVVLLNKNEFWCLLQGMESLLEGWTDYIDEMEDQESDAYITNRASCLAFIERRDELTEMYRKYETELWEASNE